MARAVEDEGREEQDRLGYGSGGNDPPFLIYDFWTRKRCLAEQRLDARDDTFSIISLQETSKPELSTVRVK